MIGKGTLSRCSVIRYYVMATRYYTIPHQGQGQRLDHKYIHKMGVEWCVLFILCDKTKILFMLVFMLNVPL